jgi:hypothetical protein
VIVPYVEIRDWILGKRSADELISLYAGLQAGDQPNGA